MKNEEYGENLTILQANVLKEEEVERIVNWLSENVDQINIVVYSVGVIGSNSLLGMLHIRTSYIYQHKYLINCGMGSILRWRIHRMAEHVECEFGWFLYLHEVHYKFNVETKCSRWANCYNQQVPIF